MRAAVFEQFGEPAEVLSVTDVPAPEPGPGEVRVRMLASPVNPSDLMTVRGEYGRLPELPATPGFEGVGVVEASGGGLLGRLYQGKRVAVLNSGRGNWSERTVLPARQVVPLDAHLSPEQGAMFFVNPATAFIMTRKVLRVPPGAWLLQTAAASTLGRLVVRLGRRYGFRTLNVVRRREQADALQELGGDATVVFDPAQQDEETFHEEVRQHTGKRGIAYAIDPVGGATGSAVVRCLAPGGRMLVYGTLSGEPLSFSPRSLMTPGACIEGFWLARWMENLSLAGKITLIRSVTRLMREGVLAPEAGEWFPLEQIAEAVRAAEQPGREGKVLLRIAES